MADPQTTNERPEIFVSALTANTVEIAVELTEGTVRLICEHGGILLDLTKSTATKVRIKP